jgi:hypothetical protein
MTPPEIAAERPAPRSPLGLRLNENARRAIFSNGCFTDETQPGVAGTKSFIEACVVEVDVAESTRLTARPTACAGVDVEAELSMTPREIVAEHPASRGPLGLRLNENKREPSSRFAVPPPRG